MCNRSSLILYEKLAEKCKVILATISKQIPILSDEQETNYFSSYWAASSNCDPFFLFIISSILWLWNIQHTAPKFILQVVSIPGSDKVKDHRDSWLEYFNGQVWKACLFLLSSFHWQKPIVISYPTPRNTGNISNYCKKKENGFVNSDKINMILKGSEVYSESSLFMDSICVNLPTH